MKYYKDNYSSAYFKVAEDEKTWWSWSTHYANSTQWIRDDDWIPISVPWTMCYFGKTIREASKLEVLIILGPKAVKE